MLFYFDIYCENVVNITDLMICRLDLRKQQKKLLCINKSAGFYMRWNSMGIYVILDESIENALI